MGRGARGRAVCGTEGKQPCFAILTVPFSQKTYLNNGALKRHCCSTRPSHPENMTHRLSVETLERSLVANDSLVSLLILLAWDQIEPYEACMFWEPQAMQQQRTQHGLNANKLHSQPHHHCFSLHPTTCYNVSIQCRRQSCRNLSDKCIHIHKKNSVMNPLMNASETGGSLQTIIGSRCLEGVFFFFPM